MKLPNIYKCNSTDILNTTLIDFVDESVTRLNSFICNTPYHIIKIIF